jgi:hypothetical protein
MHPPNAANLEVARDRLLDLNCKICFGPKHEVVGALHRTVQVNEDLGVRAYELHQFGRDPEGAEPLCHRDPYFAFERLSQSAAAPDETLRRFFHSSGEREKFLPVIRKPDTIVVTREQEDVELPFQLLDALADGRAGHPQSLCGCAEAAGPGDLKENPDIVPVWTGDLGKVRGVLSFLSTVSGD